MSVKLHGLFEGHPDGSREALHHGAGPQRENIDSAIGCPVVARRIPPYGRGAVQSGPSSRRAAGLWPAPALPLTAERAVSAIGFRRGNEELKRGEKLGQNGNA